MRLPVSVEPTLPQLHLLADIRVPGGTRHDGGELLALPGDAAGETVAARVANAATLRAAQAEGQALPEIHDAMLTGTLVGKGVLLAVPGDRPGRIAAIVTEGPTLAGCGVGIITPKPDSGLSAAWACLVLRAQGMPAFDGTPEGFARGLRAVRIEVLNADEQAARCEAAASLHAKTTELRRLLAKQMRLLAQADEAAVRNLVQHGSARPIRTQAVSNQEGHAGEMPGGQVEPAGDRLPAATSLPSRRHP